MFLWNNKQYSSQFIRAHVDMFKCLVLFDQQSKTKKYSFFRKLRNQQTPTLTLISSCSSPEHSNYFGTDEKMGAVAISIRREKLEDTKDLKDQYQYRLIVRTSEVR